MSLFNLHDFAEHMIIHRHLAIVSERMGFVLGSLAKEISSKFEYLTDLNIIPLDKPVFHIVSLSWVYRAFDDGFESAVIIKVRVHV
jgi:hypothetical protein